MTDLLRKENIEKTKTVKEIDEEALAKSLFICFADIKTIRNNVDRKIKIVSETPYVNGIDVMGHYEWVIRLVTIRNDINMLYNAFSKWRSLAKPSWVKLFHSYYEKRNGKECMKIYPEYYTVLKNMGKRFLDFMQMTTHQTKAEILDNPFVWNTYVSVIANKNAHVLEHPKAKGGKNHDCSTNEGCDSICL